VLQPELVLLIVIVIVIVISPPFPPVTGQQGGSQRFHLGLTSGPLPLLLSGPVYAILIPVNRLTKREQLVLCIVIGLLLLGWTVKAYRAAHPRGYAVEPVKL
jgi:hypothetical protein